MLEQRRQLVWISLFAIAMAQVEASVVVHLRTLYYPNDLYALFPIPQFSDRDLIIELIRESATVIMITSIVCVITGHFLQRFARFVYIFGLWDIFYYIWLKLMIDWPQSWGEWDILFLIPWYWFGPWITPVLIALLFVVWGFWIITGNRDQQFRTLYRSSALYFAAFLLGSLLCITSFLLPAVPQLLEEQGVQGYQPSKFNWFLFVGGFLLMMGGLWKIGLQATAKNL